MAKIQYPNGIEGSEDLPRTTRLLQNIFKTRDGRLLYRPGISGLNTIADTLARGAFVWNGSLYMVFALQLIKITDTTTGAFSVIVGNIAGSDVIETDVGFNEAVIVVKSTSGSIYTLDKTDTLVEIWDGAAQTGNANFASCVDVTFINDRFVYIPADGSPTFFSDPGAAGTVNVLSFFDAQVLPDKNNASFNFRNTLYIMGTDSIELFKDIGTSPVPFGRRSGGAIDNGFIGGLLEYDNTFLFIGRKKNQSPGIFAISQGTAPKISNEAIDLLLSTYTLEELGEAIPGRINWRGNDIATFALRRDSFGFLNGNWFRLETLFNNESFPWGAGFIAQFEGEYFTAFEERIGKFTKINTDYGSPITRKIIGGIEQPDNNFFSVQEIQVGIVQGENAAVGSVNLRLSRTGVQFGDPLTRNLGDLGEYGSLLRWNYYGGLGTFEGFMAYEISSTENIAFSNDYFIMDAQGQLTT